LTAATRKSSRLLSAGPKPIALRAPERRVDRQNILTTEAIVAEIADTNGGGGGMPDMSGMM
jgi:hypothetical protein